MRRVLPPRPLRILILFALVIALSAVVVVLLTRGGGQGEPPIAGIPCERSERLDYHVHAHLDIFIEGREAEIPSDIGITGSCHYWLHTHDASGIIHVEAPAPSEFTLQQFFAIWGQPLSSTTLLDRQTGAGQEIRAFVNGEPFQGDPRDILLEGDAVIVLQYGPPFPAPPPFQFP